MQNKIQRLSLFVFEAAGTSAGPSLPWANSSGPHPSTVPVRASAAHEKSAAFVGKANFVGEASQTASSECILNNKYGNICSRRVYELAKANMTGRTVVPGCTSGSTSLECWDSY